MKTRLRIVIIGSGGRMGAALAREYAESYAVTAFDRAQLDLSDTAKLRSSLAALDFDLLINCAGLTNVDGCEKYPAAAFCVNADAPEILAQICAEKSARLIHISTDYVFDGAKSRPYREEDEAKPISVYGQSKLEGEQRVLAVSPNHLVVRVSWVFGPDRPSFVDWVIDQAREHETVSAVADKFSTPTYTLDLVEMLQPLFSSSAAQGIIHLANTGECSWCEYGQWALDCCHAEGTRLRARKVNAISLSDMKNFIARRPPYTVLSTVKYEELTHRTPRDWHDAVADYVERFYAEV
ncbi:MAG: dTDP-4-dehydrorhamnose reductase [Chthoniobacterales bacterium]